MSGRRQYAGGAAVLCLALLAGCEMPGGGDGDRGAVQDLLDVRARALLAHDAKAYRATEDPEAGRRAAALADAGFGNLAEVPLSSYTYRLTGFEPAGSGRARGEAELGYRISGYDRASLTTTRTLDLRWRGGKWYVAGERPGQDGAEQFWEQGHVHAVRGAHSLVLGVGQPAGRLKEFARLADRAVPRVTDAWGADWRRRVVVVAPRSLPDMAELLDAEPSSYRGIAAVTTGEVGGSERTPADRVIINPEAFGQLGSFGKQVVMTHETTHVATRTRTGAATPLWLSEGLADWAGYRGTGRAPALAAPELARAVRAGRVPRALPEDRDFAFGRDGAALARSYESGWLACRMITGQWSEARLRAFYTAVGSHGTRDGAVQAALRKVLGVSTDTFLRRWQAYVRAELGQRG